MIINVVLDVERMTITPHGLKDFVWPLTRKEVLAMRDTILPPLVYAARGHSEADGELLSIVLPHFIKEAMELYQAHALCRRFSDLGYRPIVPAQSCLLPALATGIAPSSSPFLESLLSGPSRAERWSWIPPALRRIWRSVPWNGLSLSGLRSIDPKCDIVALQASPLINCHARAESDIVKYSSLKDWFNPLDGWSERSISRLVTSTATINAAMDTVKIGFAAGNEKLPDYLASYLRAWLVKATGLARCHLSTLLQQPDRLPRRLWTGTGGSIWARILRHAARRLGGVVTGHDHGVGTGHLVSSYPTLVEFESCDTFVTFTRAQATALQRGLRDDLLIPTKAPEIIALPSCCRPAALTKIQERKSRTRLSVIRKVMYPSSFYNGERMHFGVRIPDPVAVDWEGRLFSHLGAWNYKVLHKPHPHSVALPPAAFQSRLGVRILSEPFERVIDQADVLIFAQPQSTAFVTALTSDKPIVFVDLGLFKWVPEAYEMLKRRCRVVRGWFDKENRAQVNWDELREAIEESRDLKDPSFVETYLKYWE